MTLVPELLEEAGALHLATESAERAFHRIGLVQNDFDHRFLRSVATALAGGADDVLRGGALLALHDLELDLLTLGEGPETLALVAVFSLRLGWLPSTWLGAKDDDLLGRPILLVLPVVVLLARTVCTLSRQIRAGTITALEADPTTIADPGWGPALENLRASLDGAVPFGIPEAVPADGLTITRTLIDTLIAQGQAVARLIARRLAQAQPLRATTFPDPLPADEPTVRVAGVRCISTESAVVLTAVRHGMKAGVVAADAALHNDLVDVAGLSAATTRLALGVRGSAKAARLLQLVDASSESPGESLTRMLLVGLGALFATQVELRDAHGFIGGVDFLVERRIVVEFDGLVKYDGVQGREALAAEKRREDRLRAAGYEVVRLTWADLQAPGRVALLLRQARSRAALRSA